jgi:hypothetical protein
VTFEAYRVTSSRLKYNYVMPQLPEEVAVSISDLLETSANYADPYEQLKTRINAAYGVSKYQRANDLLDMPALGDTKPSILMAKMLAIRPPDGILFEACLLRRLPCASTWGRMTSPPRWTSLRPPTFCERPGEGGQR